MSNAGSSSGHDRAALPMERHGKRHGTLRRSARRCAFALLIAAGLFVAAVIVTTRWGNRALWPPAPGALAIEISIVNHGYHSGLVLSRAALAELAGRRGLSALGQVTARFADYDWLEIGWGDAGFYREGPTAGSLTMALALRALLRPGNPSVLHVVGVKGDPRAMFPYSDLVRVDLGAIGFERMSDRLEATFARDRDSLLPEPLGLGLYGPSLFFRANGAFHLFSACNHWVADLLDAAGVPTSPVLATLPFGLLLDLEWRSGLAPLPRSPIPKS
jgi:uncharacterized protein (TIGR02117 family)